jgi:hypothetical protein
MSWVYEREVMHEGEIALPGYPTYKIPTHVKFKGRNIFGSEYIRDVYVFGESKWSPATESITYVHYIHMTLLNRIMNKIFGTIAR